MSRTTPNSYPQTQSSSPHKKSRRQFSVRLGAKEYLTKLLEADVMIAVAARIIVDTRRHHEE